MGRNQGTPRSGPAHDTSPVGDEVARPRGDIDWPKFLSNKAHERPFNHVGSAADVIDFTTREKLA
jgi:hypothetical protein